MDSVKPELEIGNSEFKNSDSSAKSVDSDVVPERAILPDSNAATERVEVAETVVPPKSAIPTERAISLDSNNQGQRAGQDEGAIESQRVSRIPPQLRPFAFRKGQPGGPGRVPAQGRQSKEKAKVSSIVRKILMNPSPGSVTYRTRLEDQINYLLADTNYERKRKVIEWLTRYLEPYASNSALMLTRPDGTTLLQAPVGDGEGGGDSMAERLLMKVYEERRARLAAEAATPEPAIEAEAIFLEPVPISKSEPEESNAPLTSERPDSEFGIRKGGS